METVTAKNARRILEKSMLADGYEMIIDLEKSKGSTIYDSENDKTYIDFFSFFASNPIGFNHPRMSEKAFENKLLHFSKVKISNSDVYTTALAEFVQSFHQNCAPMFDRFFFIEGGALGVENALKAAQDWKVQKNLAAGRGEKGMQVMHFKEAFHGRTGYTLSLTNTVPDKIRHFPKFDWPRITNPKMVFPLTPASLEKTIELEKTAVAEMEKAFQDRPHEICAIILETIQGEGGDNFFRKEFFQTLRQLADKHEALLIFDEVQTGMGITGKMWAFEHYGVQPDLMSFGKKVQVCGCAAKMTKLQEVDNVFKIPSRINSTFGGGLVDMVRTTQYIEIIKDEKLLENAETMGRWMLETLRGFEKQYDILTNSRGLGLWIAFDLPTPELRNKMSEACWNNGVIVLSCGQKSIRLRPVLDLKKSEAEAGLALIEKSLKQVRG